MKKIILAILCLISCINVAYAENDENTFNLDSHSAVIMDANTKRVLYSYNGDDKHYPASITKVMTMLLGIENVDLKQRVTISEYGAMSVEYGSSHISIMPGETLVMRDVLIATQLASANDGANLIAEAVAGDIEKFIPIMNQRAKEIGCTNTNFMNPNGLHDDEHYTTAVDIAKIMCEASNNPTYIELTSIDEHEIKPTNKTEDTRYLYGTNQCMYDESEYFIPEVVTGKSGYTDESGNTFVAYAKKGDVELVVALMEANGTDALYTDLQTLFDYGFKTYTAYTNLADKIKLPDIDYSLFTTGGDLKLSAPFDAPACVQKDQKNYKFNYVIDETKVEDAKVDDIVGKVELLYEDQVIDTRNLIVVTPVKSIFASILNFLFTLIKILVIVAILAVVGLVAAKKIYTYYKNKQIRERRRRRGQ